MNAITATLALIVFAVAAHGAPPSPNSGGGTTEKTGHGFGWIDPSGGAYQDRIDIDVPPFHDLEPELALAYGSGGGNGYAGVGWALSGLSVIERAGHGRGAPAYDASDLWLLDGAILRPCNQPHGPSASCDNGGTHFPEQERFERIRFLPGSDEASTRWEITDGDGTTTTYRPVQLAGNSAKVFRFAVSTVSDPDGHRVDYAWDDTLFGGGWLYPRRISYRTGEVELHWEPRPDVESYADGMALTTVRGRVKTILVFALDTVGSRRMQAAYRLRYTEGPLTGRSLLQSIQEFGSDAVLQTDANGEIEVTGGASHPATQLTYTGASPSDYGATGGDSGLGVWCAVGSGNGSTGQLEYTGDFDGDGRQDLGCRASGIHYIAYSRSDATVGNTGFVDGGPKLTSFCSGPWDRDQQLNADYDGDGMTDLGCLSAGTMRIARSTGSGIAAAQEWASGWCAGTDDRGFGGDFDGDGAADLGCRSGGNLLARLSTRSGFTPPGVWATGWCAAPGYQFAGDFNGDGRTDVACRTAGGTGEIAVLLSVGTGFAPPAPWVAGWCPRGDGIGMSQDGTSTEYLFTGDFNGDGKEDLGCRSGDGRQQVALSTGRGFVAGATPWDATPALCPNGASGGRTFVLINGQVVETVYAFQYPSDFNADGRTDLACRAGNLIYVALSTGRSFNAPIALASGCVNGTESGTGGFPMMIVGDFDGDGRTDAVCRQADGRHTVSLVSHAVPDLLFRRSNGFGGTLEVRYRVATSWPDTRGMRGMTVEAITQRDGRTAAAETTFSYAGGRYDGRHKTSLGFATVRTMPPPIGSETGRGWTEVTYHQTYALRGAPRVEEQRSSRDVLLARVENEYAFESDGQALPPYRVLPVARRSYEVFDGASVRTCDAETMTYDEFGHAVLQTDLGDCDTSGDEVTTRTTYVPNRSAYLVNLPAAVEVRLGATVAGALLEETRTVYDGNGSHLQPPHVGRPTRAEVRTDETQWSLVQTEYDTQGNPVRVIDPLGAVTTTAFDTHDRPTRVTNPLGHVVSTTFDPVCGLPATTTDANGGVTRTTFDPLCRAILVEGPDGGFVRTQYVELGNPSRQHVLTEVPPSSGMSGNAWTRSYSDGLGRVYRTLARGPSPAQAITQETQYDAQGNVVAVSEPYYWDGLSPVVRVWTETVYDARGDAVETRHADGARSLLSRWLRDTFTTDPMGHRTMERQDGQGRVVLRGEVLDRSEAGEPPIPRWLYTTYEYDGRGGLHRVTDPKGNVTTYVRDWDDRVIREVDPDRGVRTYAYDRKGRLTESLDALGQRTAVVYDALDRPLSRTVGSGRKAVVHRFEYDDVVSSGAGIGRMTRASHGTGNAERYHYDRSGRVDRYVREIDGVAYVLTYTYDVAGKLVRIGYPDGSFDTGSESAVRLFDDAGRLRSIPGVIDHISYDAANRARERRNANGTVTQYGYDSARGWLTSLRTTHGALVLQDEMLDRDRDGLVRRVYTSGVSPSAHPGPTLGWSFDYDSLHELLDAVNETAPERSDDFAYDDIGNLVATRRNGGYSYPASGASSTRPHAVAAMGKHRFRYDANGNMTRGRRASIRYDAARMPIKIGATKYAYDTDGERYRAQRGSRITRWVTNDYEIAPDGTVTKYIKLDENDGDGFSLVMKTVGSGASTRRYTLHADEQGSIEVVTDEAGAVVHRREYGPWGDVQWQSSSFRQERGYTGHYHEADSGLIYMRARYYDPVLGRFLQADEVVDGNGLLGLNRYGYVQNSPTNKIDPTGRIAWAAFAVSAMATIADVVGIADAAWNAAQSFVDDMSDDEFVDRYYRKERSDGTRIPKTAGSGLAYVHKEGGQWKANDGGNVFVKDTWKFAFWLRRHVIAPRIREKYADEHEWDYLGSAGCRIPANCAKSVRDAGRRRGRDIADVKNARMWRLMSSEHQFTRAGYWKNRAKSASTLAEARRHVSKGRHLARVARKRAKGLDARAYGKADRRVKKKVRWCGSRGRCRWL